MIVKSIINKDKYNLIRDLGNKNDFWLKLGRDKKIYTPQIGINKYARADRSKRIPCNKAIIKSLKLTLWPDECRKRKIILNTVRSTRTEIIYLIQ